MNSDSIFWKFDRKAPNAPQTEPIEGELFEGHALEAPACALVREIIQNSLDARAGEVPVTVRFTVPDKAPLRGFSSTWLAGLEEHLLSERNGLSEVIRENHLMSVMLIEDYGTSGLSGDILQTNDTAREYREMRNHFFYFWRAVGSSGKKDSERGSWGLGKTVIPASSCLNTFWGLSCRPEQENLDYHLMGLSILKHHNLDLDAAGTEPYTPYGRFGVNANEDQTTMPISQRKIIEQFCQDFGVDRMGKPGLSLVVLQPLDRLFPQSFITAAVSEYFHPILEGLLIVEVVAGDKTTQISQSTIEDESLYDDNSFKAHSIDADVLKHSISLAKWSIENKREGSVRLAMPDDPLKPKWSHKIFNVEGWDHAQVQFKKGMPVEFSIPLMLDCKNGDAENAEFYVLLQKISSNQKAKTVFLRDGIMLSDIRETVSKGVAAFVAIEGEKAKPLAKYLRSCENPAHTSWNEQDKRLKQLYKAPTLPLRFVKNSVKYLYDQLTIQEEAIDTNLLSDIFFIEDIEDTNATVKSPNSLDRGKASVKPSIPKLEETAETLRVGKRGKCVLLASHQKNEDTGQHIRIRIAYNVSRGNPFKKWTPEDFDLREMQDHIQWSGAQLIIAEGCVLEFRVLEPQFEVLIPSLHTERDLRIEAKTITD